MRWTPKTGELDKVGQPSEVQHGTSKEALERRCEGACRARGCKEREDLERESQGAQRDSPNEMPPESGVLNGMFQWRKTLTGRSAEPFERGSTA